MFDIFDRFDYVNPDDLKFSILSVDSGTFWREKSEFLNDVFLIFLHHRILFLLRENWRNSRKIIVLLEQSVQFGREHVQKSKIFHAFFFPTIEKLNSIVPYRNVLEILSLNFSMWTDHNQLHHSMTDFACTAYLFEWYSMPKQSRLNHSKKLFLMRKKTHQNNLPARLSGNEFTPRVTPNRADSKKPCISLS